MEKLHSLKNSLCSYCFKYLVNKPYRILNNVTSKEKCSMSEKSLFAHERWSQVLGQESSMLRLKLLTRIGNTSSELLLRKRNISTASFIRCSSTSGRDPVLPPKKAEDQGDKTPITWKVLVVAAGIGAGILFWMQSIKKEKEQRIEKARQKYYGKALLGGDWTLTDHFGNKRSSTDFRGQWLLIYFGFTHCPDVCPEEMEKIVNVIKKTDNNKELPKIQPIIITVDPERDTPEALKEYCGEFSPRLLGFTGTEEEILAATRAYRVYYSAGPKDEDKDYIVDHSIISYLVNPRGEFVDFFGQDQTVTQMYATIRFHINKYLQEEKSSQNSKS